ncbi:adenine deaminase [Virgibacillus indicus]|uniref:Adenine deaminase n=1 Tax=Virgibacillus indicus TaxID=2024554 RepID=A0A265N936_9BACI|nr:adenine deaminase [Virgibacillus indicus]OZU87826.1 adenine deaminase [Virgibacillus indicus]
MDRELLKKRIEVAAKKFPADTVIKNGKIIDVFNQEIIEADIAIADGVFAGIGNYEGENIIDAKGKFVSPGFIDGHVHIESAMVTPAEFANVVLPHGVTSVVADPHEIANVNGIDGIKFMIDASENIPLNVFFGLPSCVPATSFENAGASLAAEDLFPLYGNKHVISLGEVMDFPSVFNGEDKMVDKLIDAKKLNKVIDGHAAGVDQNGINVYMAAGIHSDHECTTAEQAKDRLQRGMYVMLREGSASRDLKSLLHAINERNARRCLFVTDDKHLDDLIEEGSIDHNVRVTIQHGLAPITAIQMATLNAAECFGMKNKGAIAPGYDADFLFLDSLESIKINEVFVKGSTVARNGQTVMKYKNDVQPSDSLVNSVQMKEVTVDDLIIELSKDQKANIISIIPNSIVTKHKVQKVDVVNGRFQPSAEEDFLKMAVIERHNNKGNVGLGILHGLGLKSGAIASTFAHDSHNIVAAGTNDNDLLLAINCIKQINGGLVVVDNGSLLASLPLAISGLISNEGFHTVYTNLQKLNDALGFIGFSGNFNPFITLSFMALPVIPEIKLTDIGLFDVQAFKHIPIKAGTPLPNH